MQKKKILIVDDTRTMREILKGILKHEYDIIEASNVSEAIPLIISDQPDAVILDIVMPGNLNGYDLCMMIKLNPNTRNIFAVMVSGDWQTLMNNCGNMYADAFFTKPVPPQDLRQTLRTALLNSKPTTIQSYEVTTPLSEI